MARYEKLKIIGTGTFGNVWLVRSKLTRQSYVLKEINLNSLSETEQRQALTEAEVLSKCRHKHIIRHKEALINESKYLLIFMEYAEGGDLYSAILGRKGTYFKDHQIISWFIQICLALQYIHFKNILHRDLKSQNIFLTLNNVIKIGDFGIARLLQGPEELVKTAIGTPYYLSPEIFQRKPYNHKCDIWALGCVLFEMTALEHAFKAKDFFQLANAVLCGNRRELPRKCSPIIRELVHKLLKTDPEERPSTSEILEFPALQPYLSEYMAAHNTRDNYLPVLTGQSEKNSRRCSIGAAPMQDNSKRRASIGATQLKAPKRENFLQPKETVKAKPPNNRSMASKKCQKPSSVLPEKSKQDFTYTRNVANETSGFRRNKLDKLDFVASSGTYVFPTNRRHPKPASKLCESEDPSLSGFYDYSKNTTKCMSDSECDISHSHSSFFDATTVLTDSEDHIASGTYSTFDGDDVFDCSEGVANYTMTNEAMFAVGHRCHHSQCHQCILDTLWKNRIRCCVGVSVDRNEYQRLKDKLHSVYGNELFKRVYKSLIFDWDEKEDTSKTKFQTLMNSLNYDQVQTLPLMLQFIQLDLLQSRKGAN